MSQETLNELFEAEVDRLFRYFYVKFFDRELAQDLVGEVFLALAQQIKKGREVEDPKKYLYGIAKRTYIKALRKKYLDKLFAHVADITFIKAVEETERIVKTGQTLEEYAAKFIDQLPQAQKMVARLRFIEKLDLKEICTKLGKNMNYVKTTQRRAIAGLKKLAACTP